MQTKKLFKNILYISTIVLLTGLVVFTITNAGSLSPTASPASTFYTLADIYTRLTTNATATEANHNLNTNNSPSATFYTLKQIYDAIPTIDATKVLTGNTYLGVAGTALSNMWNGTGQGITGGTQFDGGVDDFNNYESLPSNSYTAIWTQCTVENNYCSTGDSGADAKDNNTGLIWSKSVNSSTYVLDDSVGKMTWYKANNCAETSGSVCTKKTSSNTGCEATTGWVLPNQKQMLQAYIDGSYGNLESLGTYQDFWSATTVSDLKTLAWIVDLSNAYSNAKIKTASSSYAIRCVRTAP